MRSDFRHFLEGRDITPENTGNVEELKLLLLAFIDRRIRRISCFPRVAAASTPHRKALRGILKGLPVTTDVPSQWLGRHESGLSASPK